MVRGPKKHMKRLNAPRHWMLDKLGGVFAPKPAAGAAARFTMLCHSPCSATTR
jgi:ribosomal protein S4E